MANAQARFVPPGPLGFGGAPLGNMFQAIDDQTAAETLEAAWRAGVRYFDTAPHYGSGLSEHRFGAALRQCERDGFVLSTKVGRLLEPDGSVDRNHPPFVGTLPFREKYDYSADGTLRSIEDSLQRLGMARIDIAFIHDVAEDAHGAAWTERFAEAMRGAARALTRLREEGVVKAWGLGVNRVEPCQRCLEEADPDLFLLAGRYSLLDQTALDTVFPACAARGARVVVGGPYNSGVLAGGAHFEYASPDPGRLEARERLLAVCREHGVDMRAAALQFCAAHPVVAAVIPGAKHAHRVRENVKLMNQPIGGAFWQALKHRRLIPEHAPTPG